MRKIGIAFFVVVVLCLGGAVGAPAAELIVGVSEANITPGKPIALWGQMHTRIGTVVESPVTAQIVALESREGQRSLDSAVMISCDIIGIPEAALVAVRRSVAKRLPGFDPQKLFINGTHTHTGPVFEEGLYQLPKEGVVTPTEYVAFFVERVTEAVARAWGSRKPGSVAWGLGHAVVGQNRRAVYADGRAVMYGATNVPDFRGIEGYEDHAVETLFFFDANRKLLAAAVNLACTAQEVEARSAVNADFFHEVRQGLRKRYGAELKVLGWISSAGDQSPHLMFRQKAEDRMRELRGLNRLQEIARRIVLAVGEAYEGAQKDIRTDVVFSHHTARLKLPMRQITAEEAADAKTKVAALSKDPANRTLVWWNQGVVDRYQKQKPGSTHEAEIHVLRLGDVAICTNPFELFLDFGIQMKSRSRAIQTFVIQLAGPGGYLATARAVRGGGYSAVPQSTVVGPEGGQVLTDATIQAINALWPDK